MLAAQALSVYNYLKNGLKPACSQTSGQLSDSSTISFHSKGSIITSESVFYEFDREGSVIRIIFSNGLARNDTHQPPR